MNKLLDSVGRFFKLEERSTTFKKELVGGLSTFLAMAYILGVNPGMLGGNDISLQGVFFLATALTAILGTTLMAFVANVPFALAPGMGVNAFFAFTVANGVLGLGISQALIATFFSGILYAIIAITPLRHKIAKLLPKNVKLAIGAMTGLFLAYIGLVDSGIIVSDAFTPAKGVLVTATATKLGDFKNPLVLIAIATMILVFVLHYMKVKGAAVIAMLLAIGMMGMAKGAGVADANKAFVMNDYKAFNGFGQQSKDMWNAAGSAFANGKFYIAVFVFLYIDFFDTTGTLFTVGEQAGLNKDPKQTDVWMKKANLVDAVSTISGSVLLSSTTTTYSESAVGVSQGARTGLSSMVVAVGFALSIVIWPIMSPIMPIATHNVPTGKIMPVTGPILVLVGALMISQLKNFEWSQTVDIPTLFITLIFGMLGYSISTGIAAGIIMHVIINTAAWGMTEWKHRGGKTFTLEDETINYAETKDLTQTILSAGHYKKRVINPVMLTLFAMAIAYFATMPLYA